MSLICSEIKKKRNCKIGSMEEGKEILLSGVFVIFPKSTIKYKVILTSDKISYSRTHRYYSENNRDRQEIKLSDVIGCHSMRGKLSEDRNSYFCIYSYPVKRTLKSGSLRRRLSVTFEISDFGSYEENFQVSQNWKTAILVLAYSKESNRLSLFNRMQSYGITQNYLPLSKKLLILINPKGGQGKALQIFQERAVPVLAESSIYYHVIVTEYANHARDIMKQITPLNWNGIVIVSGDGLIFEVINGLYDRSDWRRAISTPIGTIPGGSGNGLHASIVSASGMSYSTNFIQHSILALAKSNTAPLDLLLLETCDGKQMLSFLSVTWGIVADIDIESERFRHLGTHRFTLETITKIMQMRVYKGRLSYLPATNYHPPAEFRHITHSRSATNYTNSINNTEDFSLPLQRPASVGGGELEDEHGDLGVVIDDEDGDSGSGSSVGVGSGVDSVLNARSNVCNSLYDDSGGGGNLPDREGLEEGSGGGVDVGREGMRALLLPPLDSPLPEDEGWIHEEGEFLSVNLVHQELVGADMLLVPQARSCDGVTHLAYIKSGASRKALLNIFLSLEDGSHVPRCEEFVIIPIRAFRLVPYTETGHISVDGERIKYGPVQGEIRPGLGNILTWSQEQV